MADLPKVSKPAADRFEITLRDELKIILKISLTSLRICV
jgi:hypothetical protein